VVHSCSFAVSIMAILMYGSATISPTPSVVIERQLVGNPDGAYQGWRETWRLSGEVVGSPAAVAAGYAALENAFLSPDRDLVLYADDGLTVRHALLSSATLHGVKITKPLSYPKGDGAELATLRSWTIELSGVKLLFGAPSATAWGDHTVAFDTDAQGQIRVTLSGTYRGAGAQALLNTLKLTGSNYRTLSENQRYNPDTQEWNFTYAYARIAGSRELVTWVETIAVDVALDEFVFLKPLGGGAPIKQITTASTARATQSGEAVGLTGYVAPPSPAWAAEHLRSSQIVRRGPERSPDGQTLRFTTTWNYAFEFATTPSVVYPFVP